MVREKIKISCDRAKARYDAKANRGSLMKYIYIVWFYNLQKKKVVAILGRASQSNEKDYRCRLQNPAQSKVKDPEEWK